MTWSDLHCMAETLAAEAEGVRRAGDLENARERYARAAGFEAQAFEALPPEKRRTAAITAVSAVALWYKARHLEEAQTLACKCLAERNLPDFAVEQLQELLQSVWSEQARRAAGVTFTGEDVLVAVRGGQVVRGGAPLDLVVSKVEGIQALLYRTVEFIQKLPHRKRGPAAAEVQDLCRPWLFQTAPSSYQFAVAIEKAAQPTLFGPDAPSPDEIRRTFLDLLRAASEDPDDALAALVPSGEYRSTFLKLTRALAPAGRQFSELSVRRSTDDPQPIRLDTGTRRLISSTIRRQFVKAPKPEEVEETLHGVLRAVHLDEDWLEIVTNKGHVKVSGVSEAVDDHIGPLVNKRVVVTVAVQPRGQRVFRDIEGAE